jgi:hypothetical protein
VQFHCVSKENSESFNTELGVNNVPSGPDLPLGASQGANRKAAPQRSIRRARTGGNEFQQRTASSRKPEIYPSGRLHAVHSRLPLVAVYPQCCALRKGPRGFPPPDLQVGRLYSPFGSPAPWTLTDEFQCGFRQPDSARVRTIERGMAFVGKRSLRDRVLAASGADATAKKVPPYVKSECPRLCQAENDSGGNHHRLCFQLWQE